MSGKNSSRMSMLALTLGFVSGGIAAAGEEPQVDLNQLGFLTDGAKRATVMTPEKGALAWALKDQGGEILLDGVTEDGAGTHQIDFSEVSRAGQGYVLSAGAAESAPFDIAAGVYDDLKFDALAFFYHQRASTPIEAQYVGDRWARPAAHMPDEATCYGPKDFRGNDWGGCPYTLDASRGWYDAGDHGKYVVNGGISVWTLMNYYEWSGGAPAFADGAAGIPEAGNGVNDLLDEARWEMEFMLSMQVPEGATLTLPRGNQMKSLKKLKFTAVDASGLVHHKLADEYWTGLPMPPHEDPATRYLHYPSTAATLNLAATAAQCARIWTEIDEAFSVRCLEAAERAYAAAKRLPDLYAIDVTEGGSGAYGDLQLDDEFYWAATELYITTGEEAYGDDMRGSRYFLGTPLVSEGVRDIAWPAVEALGTLSLLSAANGLGPDEITTAKRNLTAAADKFVSEAENDPYGVPFDRPYNWGSNGDMANRGIILAMAYRETGDEQYRDALTGILDYLLGRNPLSQSYIAGYGENPMKAPHHRFWLNVIDEDLPPPPPGALAGGPNETNPAEEVIRDLMDKGCKAYTCYADDYRAFSLNEVAINWNAPLVWIAAAYDGMAAE